MKTTRIFSICAAAIGSSAVFAQTIDGQRDAAYTDAAVQNTQTGFGDSNLGLVDFANGSELDRISYVRTATDLYIFIGGNLENGANVYQKVAVFFDSVPGGYNRLPQNLPDIDFNRFIRFGDDGSGNGLTFDAGFEADHFIGFVNGGDPVGVFVNYSQVETISNGGVAYYLGSTVPGSNGVLSGGFNPNGVEGTIDNRNTAGVPAGTGFDPGNGATVTTGIEIRIPLAQIGNPTGPIKICAFVHSDGFDFLSNQVLAGIGGGDNLAEPRTVNFASIPGDQFVTVPAPMAPETVAPDALTLQRGQIVSGTIADLANDDNVAMRLKKFFVANPAEPFVWGTLQGTTTLLSPSSVTFRVKSRMVTGGQFRQVIDQWNWATSAYENALETNPFTTVYGTRESVASPAAGKVNASGRLQGRIRVFQTGISASPLPETDWDLVNWIVNP